MIRKEGDVPINNWTKMIELVERIKRTRLSGSKVGSVDQVTEGSTVSEIGDYLAT